VSWRCWFLALLHSLTWGALHTCWLPSPYREPWSLPWFWHNFWRLSLTLHLTAAHSTCQTGIFHLPHNLDLQMWTLSKYSLNDYKNKCKDIRTQKRQDLSFSTVLYPVLDEVWYNQKTWELPFALTEPNWFGTMNHYLTSAHLKNSLMLI
jgi:hypothetical protein